MKTLDNPAGVTPGVIRLMEMGFLRDEPVKLIRRVGKHGPLQVRVRQTDICLRVEDARLFWVK